MSGREVREYTNLSDPKDKKWGKGKDKIDDEDITFQRMVAKCGFLKEIMDVDGESQQLTFLKGRLLITCPDRDLGFSYWAVNCKQMQEVAGERGGYLHGRGALDSDDLLYLKEQMEAEEDAERLLRRTEKRAFAAFKKAASLADSSPVAVPLPLRVEPKPKSGIRQQDLLKNIVEIRPKRHRVSSPSDGNQPTIISSARASMNQESKLNPGKELPPSRPNEVAENKAENPLTSLLGLTYESSEDDED